MNHHELLESLAEYVPRSPISDQDVRELELVLGRPLPQPYRDYLTAYGGFAERNTLLYWCRSEIRDLLSFYTSVGQSGDPVAPEDCALIGFGGENFNELYIDSAQGDGPVYWGEDWGNYGRIAERFSTFLQRKMFVLDYFPTLYKEDAESAVGIPSSAPPGVDAIASALRSEGVQIESFSDRFALCGSFPSGHVLVEHWERQACWVHIRSESEADRDRLRHRILPNI